jgi:hypothetical protein
VYDNSEDLAYVAVHEVGHALGLPHEHQRLDAYCEAVQPRVQACQNCVDDGCSLSNLNLCTCSASDYAVCMNLDTTPTGSQTLTWDEYNTASQVLTDSQPSSVAQPLTVFDPESVMSYCSGRPNRSSALDRLGMEILYPFANPNSLGCRDGCLLGGSGLTLRSNGTAQDAWSMRGAFPWWSLPLRWRRDGYSATVRWGDLLYASDVTSTGQYTYQAHNKWSDSSILGRSTVEVSDAKWTAAMLPAIAVR